MIPVSIVVSLKAMPLVTPAAMAPELVMRRASVTTVEPVAEVSALSRRSRAVTALSVVLAVTWFWIRTTFSVLPATVGLLVKLTANPVQLLLAAVD